MEIIEAMDNFNNVLETSFLFRGFKFMLGTYLIVLIVTIGLMLWRLLNVGYFTILQTGQEFPLVKGKMQEEWEDSQERLKTDMPNEWKAAVLEVANMLNEILGIVGYSGENLGERLDNLLPNQLENLEQVKEANKIKNRIVQDESFSMTNEEAQQTVEVFAESLRYFEAIE
ncbi:MAG: hypothetical protein U9O20_02965 [Patescibacteria group bacterium]|nr:hypothetical protein [Patescibacteria group bacterium]